jgi:hypothetical protein
VQRIIKEWDKCFSNEFPLIKAFKKCTKSPSVFEHFDIEYDFQRMGLEYYGGIKNTKTIQDSQNKISISMLQVIENNKRKSNKEINKFKFRLVKNKNGKLCASYPEKFLLPSLITNSEVEKICNFRARERLPIVTYMYSTNQGTKIIS